MNVVQKFAGLYDFLEKNYKARGLGLEKILEH